MARSFRVDGAVKDSLFSLQLDPGSMMTETNLQRSEWGIRWDPTRGLTSWVYTAAGYAIATAHAGTFPVSGRGYSQVFTDSSGLPTYLSANVDVATYEVTNVFESAPPGAPSLALPWHCTVMIAVSDDRTKLLFEVGGTLDPESASSCDQSGVYVLPRVGGSLPAADAASLPVSIHSSEGGNARFNHAGTRIFFFEGATIKSMDLTGSDERVEVDGLRPYLPNSVSRLFTLSGDDHWAFYADGQDAYACDLTTPGRMFRLPLPLHLGKDDLAYSAESVFELVWVPSGDE